MTTTTLTAPELELRNDVREMKRKELLDAMFEAQQNIEGYLQEMFFTDHQSWQDLTGTTDPHINHIVYLQMFSAPMNRTDILEEAPMDEIEMLYDTSFSDKEYWQSNQN